MRVGPPMRARSERNCDRPRATCPQALLPTAHEDAIEGVDNRGLYWASVALCLSPGSRTALMDSGARMVRAEGPRALPAHERWALNAVSCASRTACTAVGYWDRDSITDVHALWKRWNEGLPGRCSGCAIPPSGFRCSCSPACPAFRRRRASRPALPRRRTRRSRGGCRSSMRWDGSRLVFGHCERRSSTAPSRGYAVRCVTRSFCSAVGGLVDGEPAAMRWDGTRWSVQRTAFPYPGNPVQLQGVSCVSSSWCAAAGWDDIGACTADSAYSIAVLERSKGDGGRSWRNPEISCPGSAGRGYDLRAVSCTSTRTCTAVGAAIYGWNGRRWSSRGADAPVRSRLNRGVMHVQHSPASLWASGPQGALVARLRGSRWSTVARPRRPASSYGVSCASPPACVAVGSGPPRWSRRLRPAAGSE